MSKKKRPNLQKHLIILKSEYDIVMTKENYKDLIIEELEGEPYNLAYIKEYMENNKNELTMEWGCYMLLFILNEYEKYVEDIEMYYKLLKKYPPNWYVELCVANLEFRFYGNLFKAKDMFHKALELRPNDAFCSYSLGVIYHLLGVLEKSIKYYEEAINNSHNSENPSQIRAKSLYNIAVNKIDLYNDYEEGRRLLKEALKEMPDYPQAKKLLKNIERGDILWTE